MSGIGTIDNPFDLATALASSAVSAGERVRLRGGTYTGDFVSTLRGGSKSNPIYIEPYPGETAIIDGSLSINGAYTRWQDLIFTYSGWTSRTTELPGDAADIPISKVVTIGAANTLFINNILHDLAGFYAMYPAAGSEIYGNVMYNFGWSGPDRGHAHGLYAQNIGARVTVENNISLQHFATGLKFYGLEGHCDYYTVKDNIAFNNGILYDRGIGSGGGQGCWNLLGGSWTPTSAGFEWIGNCAYHSENKIGANDTNNLCSGNAGVSGGLDHPVITGNYLAGRHVDFSGTNIGPLVDPVVSGNTFIGGADRYLGFTGNTFIDWPGTANAVFVRPNAQESGRAHVAVYNWQLFDSVEVDLSAVSGLSAGDGVSVVNVQDLFVDVVTLTLDANNCISIDMRAVSHTVAAPYQWPAPVTTFPQFGCFVIRKVI